MKSIVTLLSIACISTFGLTACASNQKCASTKTCPMTKQACTSTKGCCAASAATCPVKKSSQCCSQ